MTARRTYNEDHESEAEDSPDDGDNTDQDTEAAEPAHKKRKTRSLGIYTPARVVVRRPGQISVLDKVNAPSRTPAPVPVVVASGSSLVNKATDLTNETGGDLIALYSSIKVLFMDADSTVRTKSDRFSRCRTGRHSLRQHVCQDREENHKNA